MLIKWLMRLTALGAMAGSRRRPATMRGRRWRPLAQSPGVYNLGRLTRSMTRDPFVHTGAAPFQVIPDLHRPRSASRPSPSQSSADCVSGLDGRVLHPNLGDRAPHRLLCPACAPRSLATRSPDHIGRQNIVELAYAHLGRGFCRSSAPSQKLAQAEKLLDIPAPR